MLWTEAILIHFTVRKPKSDPAEHCHKGCNEWEAIEVCFHLSSGIVSYLRPILFLVVWPILPGDAGPLRMG